MSVLGLAFAGIGPAFVEGVAVLAASMALLGVASGAYDVAVNAEASRLERNLGASPGLASVGSAVSARRPD